MRTHGTLTQWNDDRGFGFITPAKGSGDLFVHISAFPRDGVRPRIGELISFEIESSPDGKQRAVRVMRPGRRPSGPAVAARKRPQPQRRMLGGAAHPPRHRRHRCIRLFRVHDPSETLHLPRARIAPLSLTSPSTRYSCDGRRMCSQMTSCAEATYFVEHCPNTQMDGDGDGVPCETQWCN